MKCINASDDEIRSRGEFTARSTPDRLDELFFGKLQSIIEKGKGQLRAYQGERSGKSYLYINTSFDDWVGYFQEQYYRQIDEYLLANPSPEINIVFHNNQDHFEKDLTMRAATLIN